jgi:hypothetical protein
MPEHLSLRDSKQASVKFLHLSVLPTKNIFSYLFKIDLWKNLRYFISTDSIGAAKPNDM